MTVIATRCDGCGRPFNTPVWNQRTCVACESKGFPDQSRGDWPTYSKACKEYRARMLRKAPKSPREGKPTPTMSQKPGGVTSAAMRARARRSLPSKP